MDLLGRPRQLGGPLVAFVSVALAGGCYLSHSPDAEPARDAGVDAPPPPDASPDAPPEAAVDAGPRTCRVPAPVDLLLVVDDSGSMREEQQTLARELPTLVSDLTSPPDLDGDGRPDWRAVRDLHLGVVTTGVAGPAGCSGDGILRDRSAVPGEQCARDFPPFLTYAPGDDAAQVSADYGCLAIAGVRGCFVEQPLEAAIKALLPADSDLEFLAGRPHGDRENAGFLRDDSLLAVLVLTDEDDCSFSDETFFGREEELPPCLNPTDELFPLDRYEQAFRSLRPDRPDLFAFGAITGVPVLLASEEHGVGFDELLAHPAMEYRQFFEGLVEPACESARGSAIPARRLVELARRFGSQSVVGSICQADYSRIVGAVARLVGTRACEEFE